MTAMRGPRRVISRRLCASSSEGASLVGKALRSHHDVGQGEQLAHAARELAGVEQDRDGFGARLFCDSGLQGWLRYPSMHRSRAPSSSRFPAGSRVESAVTLPRESRILRW